MTLNDKQFLFARNYARLIEYAFSIGIPVTLGEVWRPPEMQKIYYETGRSAVKISRYHGKKLAGDLWIILGGKFRKDFYTYLPLGKFWEKLGGVWGGRWKKPFDPFHFQYGDDMK